MDTIHVVELMDDELRIYENAKVMNMKVTSLGKKTNDDYILNLVISGGTEARVASMEQHMIGGVNGPSCRSEILGPAVGSVHVPDVISERVIHLLTQGHWIRLT
jgi:hypothetical protein